MKEEVTFEGWVTRDKDEKHALLWDTKPERETAGGYWRSFGEFHALPESSFPSVTWESEPKKVSVTIKAE